MIHDFAARRRRVAAESVKIIKLLEFCVENEKVLLLALDQMMGSSERARSAVAAPARNERTNGESCSPSPPRFGEQRLR